MPRKPNKYEWVAEPFLDHPSLISKPMFGCLSYYLHGKLVLVLTDDKSPKWNGILVPTEKKYQASLMAEIPLLHPHPVLGKWLYLKAASELFEIEAQKIAQMIRSRDPRVGVEPKPKRK